MLLVITPLCAPLAGLPRAFACDLCAIYTATEQRESRTGVFLGLAEQYTYYGTWQQGSEKVTNPGERLNSFITQFVAGYKFTPRIGVQVNLPLIARVYRRQETQGFVNGDETGIGDMSLLGSFVAYSDVTEQSVMRITLLGGLKLPSGNSRRIEEELQENEEAPPSGIHGHDLTLGSGSTDGIIGTQAFASWQRMFVNVGVQYLLRTEGSFDYTFANDLIWNGALGEYVFLTHQYSVAPLVALTGETKGNDTLNGVKGDDTGVTALYLGPGLQVTWGSSLAANFNVDLPVLENNSGLQIVPNSRLRAGLTWQF